MNNVYVVAYSRKAFSSFGERFHQLPDHTFHFIEDKTALTNEFLSEIQPRYIFFPHWSYIIPASIYDNYECIIFHMTDVPFGRGGSPLQNLIIRGIYETKLSALRCVKELDAGPVYLQRSLSLWGNAEEIYIRAAKEIELMIIQIVLTNPSSIEQNGQITTFKRRKPDESNLNDVKTLEEVFDYIRMLDAKDYPHAFLETEYLRFEFSRSAYTHNEIIADVRIRLKK